MRILFLLLALLISSNSIGQKTPPPVERFDIGISSSPNTAEVNLTLSRRYQQYNWYPKNESDVLDKSVFSPKSAIFSEDGSKLYVNALEGLSTIVYDVETGKKLKVIKHKFSIQDSALFLNDESTVFNYPYRYKRTNPNVFSGKPVESTLSHNGKYLWVTYYRRSYDKNAESPSAVAIIDTEKDSIVRVMPTGPLPKMIASSDDGKYVAVTHWGDNTIALIDVSAESIWDFKYVKHLVVDKKLELNFQKDVKVDRDSKCGYCLRGTVFTPDSKHLLVGRMGGGGIAVFDIDSLSYLKTAYGMKYNIRHLVINNEELYIGCNSTGFVQRTSLASFINQKKESPTSNIQYTNWSSRYVGYGVRTISTTSDGKYIFACVNGESKVSVIRSEDMKIITSIGADSYPVGMAISPDNSKLVVTSQGKKGGGGNSVMIYDIKYNTIE